MTSINVRRVRRRRVRVLLRAGCGPADGAVGFRVGRRLASRYGWSARQRREYRRGLLGMWAVVEVGVVGAERPAGGAFGRPIDAEAVSRYAPVTGWDSVEV